MVLFFPKFLCQAHIIRSRSIHAINKGKNRDLAHMVRIIYGPIHVFGPLFLPQNTIDRDGDVRGEVDDPRAPGPRGKRPRNWGVRFCDKVYISRIEGSQIVLG